MKTEQNTTQTSTALLRNANGVDMTETNNLCCTAAGIIASSSATAEELIPHEKLRGAATPDATLIARDRPPAQPVVGYKHIQDSNCRQYFRNLCARSNRHPSEGYDRTIFGQLHVISITIVKCGIREKALGIFSNIAHRMAQLQPSQCHLGNRYLDEAHLPRKRLTFLKRHNKLENSAMFWVLLIYVAIGVNRNLRCVFRHAIYFLKKLIILALHSLDSLIALLVSNPNCDKDSNHRSNSLNPRGSVFFCIKSIQHNEKSPPKGSDSKENPYRPYRRQCHTSRHSPSDHDLLPFQLENSGENASFVQPSPCRSFIGPLNYELCDSHQLQSVAQEAA